MAKKGKKSKKYSPGFKIRVIIQMRENGLSQRETVRKYWGTKSHAKKDLYLCSLKRWKRIYLEEKAAGLLEERENSARIKNTIPIRKKKERSLTIF